MTTANRLACSSSIRFADLLRARECQPMKGEVRMMRTYLYVRVGDLQKW